MKKKINAHRQLHLLTAEDRRLCPEEASSPQSQQEMDTLIANGVRRHQQLQEAFDRELFGAQDQDKLATLLSEKQLLQQRLQEHGIRVRT